MNKKLHLLLMIGGSLFFAVKAANADWSVDFSRRSQDLGRSPASVESPEKKESKGILEGLFAGEGPVEEIVILNTEKGFIPEKVRVRNNGRYKIHVVNVNEENKNISFVLEGFSEHHATYFGRIESFVITPKRSGVYQFQSPETSARGRLVVHPAIKRERQRPKLQQPDAPQLSESSIRRPASD